MAVRMELSTVQQSSTIGGWLEVVVVVVVVVVAVPVLVLVVATQPPQ